MEHEQFVARVLARLPATVTRFEFFRWKHAGRPTDEGLGVMPIAGVVPERIMDAVMDVDHYVGNIAHVAANRAIVDPRFVPPDSVRLYQRVEIPIIGGVQHELALHRLGERQGYHIAAWGVLTPETSALNKRQGIRSDYNYGGWFAAPGVLGYALSSAPRRDDVGFFKFKALTKGADAGAARVLQANIEGMARWAASRQRSK